MFPCTIHGVMAFAALGLAGATSVSILQAGDWGRVSTPAGHFSTNTTTTNQQQKSVQYALLGLGV